MLIHTRIIRTLWIIIYGEPKIVDYQHYYYIICGIPKARETWKTILLYCHTVFIQLLLLVMCTHEELLGQYGFLNTV